MFTLSRTSKITLLSVGIPTAIGLLYYLLKTSNDEEDDTVQKKKSLAATSRQTVIQVKIPKKAVGAVIGRQGATIKEIQEQSGAKANFKDDTDQEDADRTVVIRGTPQAAQQAECMIRKILADMPVIVQEEMLVPKYALGRIIGRGGESIRQMSRASKARILVDRTRDCYKDRPQVITIRGSKQQIECAKSLIQEKLDEEEVFQAKQAVSAANSQTGSSALKSSDNLMNGDSGQESVPVRKFIQDLSGEPAKNCIESVVFPQGREYVEVYVSAIANPGHFWVQTIGSSALQLDKLSESMTRYYDNEGKDLSLNTVNKDDIVAAPFANDKTWYRARVMEVMEDNNLDLFYVDYGDSAYMDSTRVKPLCQEFCALPFQAIECRLSGVKPNGEWTEEGFEAFEQLTHCAKWKRVVAKAVKFTGPLPHLELIDTNGDQDMNINEEMISSGFAIPET